MAPLQATAETRSLMRWAGVLYLIIIVTGLGAELGLRMPMIDLDDAEATAAAIRTAPGAFRLAILGDVVMALADAGLAVLLFVLFRPLSPGLSLAAMVFRLIQTAIIAASLLGFLTAGLLLAAGQSADLALVFLDLHAHGYDLGLVFFGVSSLITARLIWLSGLIARPFAIGIAAAGMVYLTGSALRFLAPGWSEAFAPAYGVTILAELAFCLRLLLQRRAPLKAS